MFKTASDKGLSPQENPRSTALKRSKISPIVLAMMIFFAVSGGPLGLETLVSESGKGMALLLILLTPLFYSVPSALMTAELTSAMPVEGGYYVWVKEAMGKFAGFLCAFWTFLYSCVDAAIYPVLAVKVLESSLAEYAGITLLRENYWFGRFLCIALVALFAALNIRGVKAVGKTSFLFATLLLLPFVIMVLLGAGRLLSDPSGVVQPFIKQNSSLSEAFGLGLMVAIWNYLGWDSMSTVAGEVEEPGRVFPKALFLALPLIVACYFLPTAIGLAFVPNVAQWSEGSWHVIAGTVGGRWLGIWVSFAQLFSAMGLFSVMVLTSSRLPFVLARDGYLPKGFLRVHKKYGTPVVAILVASTIFAFFSMQEFASLVVIDVLLYTCALLLEFAALVILRIKQPGLTRPYKIPGGLPVLILVTIMPVAVLAMAVVTFWYEEGLKGLLISLAALMLAPIAYFVLSNFFRQEASYTPE